MIEPLIALGVLAAVSIVNNIIRTLLTRQSPVSVKFEEALIVVPPSVMKKYGLSEELPYQWFSEVWKLMNAGKLNVTDEVIQEIFVARGKGRAAQKAFYLKYGGVANER
jgi:hypothetical protein